MTTFADDHFRGAVLSPDGVYRYRLWRRFNAGGIRTVNFIMLNPSTADAEKDDPTLHISQLLAVAWKFDRLIVTNLFAFRSTDPEGLVAAENAFGPDNAEALETAAAESEIIICGWGAFVAKMYIPEKARAVLAVQKDKLNAIAVTKSGHPKHPLYSSKSATYKPFVMP